MTPRSIYCAVFPNSVGSEARLRAPCHLTITEAFAIVVPFSVETVAAGRRALATSKDQHHRRFFSAWGRGCY